MQNKEPTPVEIKYSKIDIKGLLAFMKKFNAEKGYTISPKKEEEQRINGKNIQVVPAFKFLLKGNSTE